MPVAGQRIMPFLMFQGCAEEAMTFYVSVFGGAVLDVQRLSANEAGTEGKVLRATFTLMGQTFMCIDSSVRHDFTFTPAVSFFVQCGFERDVEHAFAELSREGQVLMPLAAYPFSSKFGWVQDKFGVSWQLSLALD